jgi:hypothetical protein
MADLWEYGKQIDGVWHFPKDGDLDTWVYVRPDEKWWRIRGENREDQGATTAILMHAMNKDLPCGVRYGYSIGQIKVSIRGAVVWD